MHAVCLLILVYDTWFYFPSVSILQTIFRLMIYKKMLIKATSYSVSVSRDSTADKERKRYNRRSSLYDLEPRIGWSIFSGSRCIP